VKIDLQQIKELLGIVGSTEVTELTIEFGDQRITVKKEKTVIAQAVEMQAPPVMQVHPQVLAPVAEAAVRPAPTTEAPVKVHVSEESSLPASTIAVTSPMVGTYYSAPSPTAQPFVKVGDRVNVGQTVCIIEAMKLMNDMPSEVAGKVMKICVENGTTVEYGQTLFLIDPKG
jgi:acetyl-CoA carboxylase biotin carboxyl carrier protein